MQSKKRASFIDFLQYFKTARREVTIGLQG